MKPDFEYFLHEYYAEEVNPTCLDDDLPDCTADWISNIDCEDFIMLGNLYASKYLQKNITGLNTKLGVE